MVGATEFETGQQENATLNKKEGYPRSLSSWDTVLAASPGGATALGLDQGR